MKLTIQWIYVMSNLFIQKDTMQNYNVPFPTHQYCVRGYHLVIYYNFYTKIVLF